MMFQYFSHEHPLTYTDDEDLRWNHCTVCGVALRSGPYYRCSENCKFFLHQLCSLLMPQTLFMMPAYINTTSDGKEIQHFSHEHPLIYTEDEDLRRNLCSACGVALLSSPCYRCSENCKVFLHQPCAQLIRTLTHMLGKNTYFFKLLAKPPHEDCICEKCETLCTGFTYECAYRTTERFYLHCQCAFPLKILVKHISHHEHSLMFLGKEASMQCDACGTDRKGKFFFCSNCCFHIHQDCCLLPSVAEINDHLHPLSLNYSYPWPRDRRKNCIICYDKISSGFGAYSCPLCHIGAHLNCKPGVFKEPGIDEASILPGKRDTFPSLIIRALIQSREDSEIKGGESKIDKYHSDHSSWNIHLQESDNHDLVCNGCIQPIISTHLSHHTCPQSQCDFSLHQICANLPPTLKGLFQKQPLTFFSESSSFCSLFFCAICRRRCNGFGYKYGLSNSVDVECAAAPSTIKHTSHSQHLLVLSDDMLERYMCCHAPYFYSPAYVCRVCDYNIHVHCAFLPKTVEHKFDEHPLDLIYNPTIQIPHEEDEKEREHLYLCEFCEEDVDPKLWFYYCGKCDQSFHVNCIPSTGIFSKIKFGRNLDLQRNVHDHPVTLTRMLMMGSQRCGFCKDLIPGFEDGMAFHCSMCDFWIHFDCAERALRK